MTEVLAATTGPICGPVLEPDFNARFGPLCGLSMWDGHAAAGAGRSQLLAFENLGRNALGRQVEASGRLTTQLLQQTSLVGGAYVNEGIAQRQKFFDVHGRPDDEAMQARLLQLLVRRAQTVTDPSFRQYVLRTLGIGFDLLP